MELPYSFLGYIFLFGFVIVCISYSPLIHKGVVSSFCRKNIRMDCYSTVGIGTRIRYQNWLYWYYIYLYTSNTNSGFALLGGKVFLSEIEYRTKNAFLSILSITISINFWSKEVCVDDNSIDLPYRLSVTASGVEYIIYNNSYKYDELSECISKNDSASDESKVSDILAEALTPTPLSNEKELPTFYRIFPRILVSVQDLSVMIGSIQLEYFVVLFSPSSDIILSTTSSSVPDDWYRFAITVLLRNVKGYLQENVDCVKQENIETVQRKEEFLTDILSAGLKKFFLDVMPEESYPKAVESSKAPAIANLLKCTKLKVVYYYDVPTEASARMLELPPLKNGVKAELINAHLSYGPFADRQRKLIVSYFYPFFYRHQKRTPQSIERGYSSFDIEALFSTPTVASLPYNALDENSNHIINNSFDINIGPSSSVTVTIPWVVIDDSGNSMVITGNIRHITVIPRIYGNPAISDMPFLDSHSANINVTMHYPIKWNATYTMKVEVMFITPIIYFLRDHVKYFVDLGFDWSNLGAISTPTLAQFTPCIYSYSVIFAKNPVFIFNVNESNIINIHQEYFPQTNSKDDSRKINLNSLIKLTTPDVTIDVIQPFLDFFAPSSEIKFNLAMRHPGSAFLEFPTLHPMRELLKSSNFFLFFQSLFVSGTYLYHYHLSKENIDSFDIELRMAESELKLYGHVLRYLLSFQQNYFGEHISFIDEKLFVANGYRNTLAKDSLNRNNEKNPNQNAFQSTFVFIGEGVTVRLPRHLYNYQSELTLRTATVLMESRSLTEYSDFAIDITPITLIIPVEDKTETETIHTAYQCPDILERTYLQLSELCIQKHSSFGLKPLSYLYKSTMKVYVSEVKAQLLPSQIRAIILSIDHVSNQYMDSIDYINATHSNSDELKKFTEEEKLEDLADVTTQLFVGSININCILLSGITVISLKQGVQMATSSQITTQEHQRSIIEIPEFDIVHLASMSTEDPIDVSVFELNLGFTISLSEQRADWKYALERQREFIYSQIHHISEETDDNLGSLAWHQCNAERVSLLSEDLPVIDADDIIDQGLPNPYCTRPNDIVLLPCSGKTSRKRGEKLLPSRLMMNLDDLEDSDTSNDSDFHSISTERDKEHIEKTPPRSVGIEGLYYIPIPDVSFDPRYMTPGLHSLLIRYTINTGAEQFFTVPTSSGTSIAIFAPLPFFSFSRIDYSNNNNSEANPFIPAWKGTSELIKRHDSLYEEFTSSAELRSGVRKSERDRSSSINARLSTSAFSSSHLIPFSSNEDYFELQSKSQTNLSSKCRISVFVGLNLAISAPFFLVLEEYLQILEPFHGTVEDTIDSLHSRLISLQSPISSVSPSGGKSYLSHSEISLIIPNINFTLVQSYKTNTSNDESETAFQTKILFDKCNFISSQSFLSNPHSGPPFLTIPSSDEYVLHIHSISTELEMLSPETDSSFPSIPFDRLIFPIENINDQNPRLCIFQFNTITLENKNDYQKDSSISIIDDNGKGVEENKYSDSYSVSSNAYRLRVENVELLATYTLPSAIHSFYHWSNAVFHFLASIQCVYHTSEYRQLAVIKEGLLHGVQSSISAIGTSNLQIDDETLMHFIAWVYSRRLSRGTGLSIYDEKENGISEYITSRSTYFSSAIFWSVGEIDNNTLSRTVPYFLLLRRLILRLPTMQLRRLKRKLFRPFHMDDYDSLEHSLRNPHGQEANSVLGLLEFSLNAFKEESIFLFSSFKKILTPLTSMHFDWIIPSIQISMLSTSNPLPLYDHSITFSSLNGKGHLTPPSSVFTISRVSEAKSDQPTLSNECDSTTSTSFLAMNYVENISVTIAPDLFDLITIFSLLSSELEKADLEKKKEIKSERKSETVSSSYQSYDFLTGYNEPATKEASSDNFNVSTTLAQNVSTSNEITRQHIQFAFPKISIVSRTPELGYSEISFSSLMISYDTYPYDNTSFTFDNSIQSLSSLLSTIFVTIRSVEGIVFAIKSSDSEVRVENKSDSVKLLRILFKGVNLNYSESYSDIHSYSSQMLYMISSSHYFELPVHFFGAHSYITDVIAPWIQPFLTKSYVENYNLNESNIMRANITEEKTGSSPPPSNTSNNQHLSLFFSLENISFEGVPHTGISLIYYLDHLDCILKYPPSKELNGRLSIGIEEHSLIFRADSSSFNRSSETSSAKIIKYDTMPVLFTHRLATIRLLISKTSEKILSKKVGLLSPNESSSITCNTFRITLAVGNSRNIITYDLLNQVMRMVIPISEQINVLMEKLATFARSYQNDSKPKPIRLMSTSDLLSDASHSNIHHSQSIQVVKTMVSNTSPEYIHYHVNLAIGKIELIATTYPFTTPAATASWSISSIKGYIHSGMSTEDFKKYGNTLTSKLHTFSRLEKMEVTLDSNDNTSNNLSMSTNLELDVTYLSLASGKEKGCMISLAVNDTSIIAQPHTLVLFNILTSFYLQTLTSLQALREELNVDFTPAEKAIEQLNEIRKQNQAGTSSSLSTYFTGSIESFFKISFSSVKVDFLCESHIETSLEDENDECTWFCFLINNINAICKKMPKDITSSSQTSSESSSDKISEFQPNFLLIEVFSDAIETHLLSLPHSISDRNTRSVLGRFSNTLILPWFVVSSKIGVNEKDDYIVFINSESGGLKLSTRPSIYSQTLNFLAALKDVTSSKVLKSSLKEVNPIDKNLHSRRVLINTDSSNYKNESTIFLSLSVSLSSGIWELLLPKKEAENVPLSYYVVDSLPLPYINVTWKKELSSFFSNYMSMDISFPCSSITINTNLLKFVFEMQKEYLTANIIGYRGYSSESNIYPSPESSLSPFSNFSYKISIEVPSIIFSCSPHSDSVILEISFSLIHVLSITDISKPFSEEKMNVGFPSLSNELKSDSNTISLKSPMGSSQSHHPTSYWLTSTSVTIPSISIHLRDKNPLAVRNFMKFEIFGIELHSFSPLTPLLFSSNIFFVRRMALDLFVGQLRSFEIFSKAWISTINDYFTSIEQVKALCADPLLVDFDEDEAMPHSSSDYSSKSSLKFKDHNFSSLTSFSIHQSIIHLDVSSIDPVNTALHIHLKTVTLHLKQSIELMSLLLSFRSILIKSIPKVVWGGLEGHFTTDSIFFSLLIGKEDKTEPSEEKSTPCIMLLYIAPPSLDFHTSQLPHLFSLNTQLSPDMIETYNKSSSKVFSKGRGISCILIDNFKQFVIRIDTGATLGVTLCSNTILYFFEVIEGFSNLISSTQKLNVSNDSLLLSNEKEKKRYYPTASPASSRKKIHFARPSFIEFSGTRCEFNLFTETSDDHIICVEIVHYIISLEYSHSRQSKYRLLQVNLGRSPHDRSLERAMFYSPYYNSNEKWIPYFPNERIARGILICLTNPNQREIYEEICFIQGCTLTMQTDQDTSDPINLSGIFQTTWDLVRLSTSMNLYRDLATIFRLYVSKLSNAPDSNAPDSNVSPIFSFSVFVLDPPINDIHSVLHWLGIESKSKDYIASTLHQYLTSNLEALTFSLQDVSRNIILSSTD